MKSISYILQHSALYPELEFRPATLISSHPSYNQLIPVFFFEYKNIDLVYRHETSTNQYAETATLHVFQHWQVNYK